MNLKQACNCLNINEKDILYLSEKQIKHKYHILALKYHPDKNKSLDANERFQELQEAYETICIEKQIPKHRMDYRTILKQYLSFYIKDSDIIIDLLYDKLNNNIDIILEKCSRSKLITIYMFLTSHQQLLHIPNTMLMKLQEYIHKKTMHIEIECSFKDIWEQKIYILKLDAETLYIPLWHSKLSYEIQGIVCEITCKCKEKHIIIDRLNNVNITLQKSCYSDKDYDIPILGKRHIPISPDINNTIVLKEEGIPIINEDNLYDNRYLSDVILTIVN